MTIAIADIAGPLRAAGLTVVEMDGWETRGEDDGPQPVNFKPLGVIWHHDGMGLGWDDDPDNNNNVAQNMAKNGNNGAQIWVRFDGVVFLLAAGRKWHAGVGAGWAGIPADSGNTYAVGIETDHTFGNPWPDVQVQAIITVSAVLGNHYGWLTSNMCGHKEYAPGRKPDPEGIDCTQWRALVGQRRIELNTHPTPVPPEDEVTQDDIDKIVAGAVAGVMDALQKQAVVQVEFYDDEGKADPQKVSVTRALQSAQTQATRANKKLSS